MTTIRLILFICACFIGGFSALAQELPRSHDPKAETYLSPSTNKKICPTTNPIINPLTNWKLNPFKNKDINPFENTSINPQYKPNLNPNINELLNPQRTITLYPSSNAIRVLYLFNKSDELAGYITQASQDVLLCFSIAGEWTCYYVKTPEGTYNQFEKDGTWNGNFICYDNTAGYNQFDKEGKWTGMHIK